MANGLFPRLVFRSLLCLVAQIATFAHNLRLSAEDASERNEILASRIATDGDFATLRVKVNDEWLTFGVDTGSPTTVLDAKFRSQLAPAGAAERTKAVPYRDSPELYVPPRMSVAGTESGLIPFPPECAVACRDLSWIRDNSNFPIQGVLCMDFLESYAVQLDLSEGILKLLKSPPPEARSTYECIKMEIHGRPPTVQFASFDCDAWALIDTGALQSASIQSGYGEDLYAYLRGKQQIRELTSEAEVAGKIKTTVAPVGWLRELRLGPFRHHDLFVDRDDVSLLGLYYWRRYKCIFDFPGSVVYLQKSRYYDAPDQSDHAGIYLVSVAPDLAKRVSGVARDSLGDRLGIRRGDYLLAIDGQHAGREPIHNIYRLLTFRPDREMELRLSRYGEEFRVTIPPDGRE